MRKIARPVIVAAVSILTISALVASALVIASRRFSRSLHSSLARWLTSITRPAEVRTVSVYRAPAEWSTEELQLAGLAALDEGLIAVQVYDYYARTRALPGDVAQVRPTNRRWVTADPWGAQYVLRSGPGGRFFVLSGGPAKKIEVTADTEKLLEFLTPGRTYRVGRMIVYVGTVAQDRATE